MKKYIVLIAAALALTACDQSDKNTEKTEVKTEKTVEKSDEKSIDNTNQQAPKEAEVKDEN